MELDQSLAIFVLEFTIVDVRKVLLEERIATQRRIKSVLADLNTTTLQLIWLQSLAFVYKDFGTGHLIQIGATAGIGGTATHFIFP